MKTATSFEGQNCNLIYLFLIEIRYIFSFLEDTFNTSYIYHLGSTYRARKIKNKNLTKQKIIKNN